MKNHSKTIPAAAAPHPLKETLKRIFCQPYFASFFLGVLVFALFLSYSQTLGAKYFFMEGDAVDISLTSLKQFYDDLLSGESLYYSWSNSLGMNTSAYYAYQAELFSITTPLFLIFSSCSFPVVASVCVLIKVGLASLFFTMFARKVLHSNDFWSVLLGVLYANCSVQQCYTICEFLWQDAYFMVPLLLLLLVRFCREGKWKPLPFAYAYLFLTNFYMAYIVGFFTLLFLLVYLPCQKNFRWKAFFSKMFQFAGLVLLAVCLSAFVLLPALLFILSHEVPDATYVFTMPANPLDLYNQLFAGANAFTLPHVYCGILPLLLLPGFLLNRRIPLRKKLIFLIPLLVMVLSCFVPWLYVFWHCFDAPDGFFYRFSFLISFLLCAVAGCQSRYLKSMPASCYLAVTIANLAFYAVMIILQPAVSDYGINSIPYLMLNLVFFALYSILLIFCRKTGKNSPHSSALLLSLLLLACTENVINGYTMYYKEEETYPSTLTDAFFAWEESMDDNLSTLDADTDFYRVSSPNDFNYDGDSYFGYHGISDLGSFENYDMRAALSKLGIYTSPRLILPYGTTDFTETLLAVKYRITNIPYTAYVLSEDPGATMEETGNFLSLGFVVKDAAKEFTFSGRNAFENINALASCMTGESLQLYESIPEDQVDWTADGILVDTATHKMTLDAESGTLTYTVPGDERTACAEFFTYTVPCYDLQAPIIAGGDENSYTLFGRIDVNYIRMLSQDDSGRYSVTVQMDGTTYEEAKFPDTAFAYYNEEEYERFYSLLTDMSAMQVKEYGNGYVRASVSISEEDEMLFTSIPYDSGWTVTANGEEVTVTPLLEGAFLGLDLPAGDYELEFTYEAPGASAGLWITLGGSILYAAGLTFSLLRKRKAAG